MLLSLNYLIATSLSFSNNLINSFKSLFAAQIVLSSAKFASFASFIKSNKSLINMLNNIGPGMDLWGTPDKSIVIYFFSLFSSFHMCVSECYCIHRKTISIKFAISRSRRMQSNALDKSISTAPIIFLSSRDFFQSSIGFKRTWFNYKTFYKPKQIW